MEQQVTITPNFQVHIPIAIRKKAKLFKHGKAIMKIEKSKITIELVKDDFLSLGGKFKVKKPTLAENIRKETDYISNKK